MRFIIIIAHHISIHQGGFKTDPRTDADHTAFDPGGMNNGTFGDQRFLQCGSAYLGRGKHTAAGIDSTVVVEEIEKRNFLCQIKIGFKITI